METPVVPEALEKPGANHGWSYRCTLPRALDTAERLRLEGDTKFQAEDFLGALGHYEQLVGVLEKSCETDKTHRGHACLAAALLKSSICYLRCQPRAPFLALTSCETVLRLEPSNQQAVRWKARALAELGEFAEAERQYERACELSPEDTSVRQECEQLKRLAHVVRNSAPPRQHVFDAFLDTPPEEECAMPTWDAQESASSVHATRLRYLLGHPHLVELLESSGKLTPQLFQTFAALAEQSIWMGIDYTSLGLGPHHPRSRTEYRKAAHDSICCAASRRRADTSRRRLVSVLSDILLGVEADPTAAAVTTFLVEIGVAGVDSCFSGVASLVTYDGVRAALEAELLLPLRALIEGLPHTIVTHSGEIVPHGAVIAKVHTLIEAVLSRRAGLPEWRYGNPAGMEQLRGLSNEQLAIWRQPLVLAHTDSGDGQAQTFEDCTDELGLFWATKIGGPSHGFDHAPHCLLPLLCNARHKAVLLSVPQWPAHPVARAHFRLLWAVAYETECCQSSELEPRLWIEDVNIDFAFAEASEVDVRKHTQFLLRHAVRKADALRIAVSVSDRLVHELRAMAQLEDTGGVVQHVRESIVLRPSNGVLEASDCLSSRHDWVQLNEEVVGPMDRSLYVPARCSFAFRGRFLAVVAEPPQN